MGKIGEPPRGTKGVRLLVEKVKYKRRKQNFKMKNIRLSVNACAVTELFLPRAI
jgi:hypothetical protein